MISFITNYDDNTQDNLTVFNNLGLTGFTVNLHSDDATKNNLHTELSARDINCFAMSHGDIDILKDQHGNNAFDQRVLGINNTFNVFAYACNTSIILGETAAAINVNWLGYISPINAPCTDIEMNEIYTDIFSYVCDSFPNVNCPERASSFIEGLKSICEQKNEELYDMRENNSYEAGISTHMNMRELWQKLKIWLESSGESIENPSTMNW
ncbi:hypothetical protein [Shewanella sp. UCD-KL12]|uniref:hypothetical protein n=1 Tax=Shewanella sp. UCD-KL12 TaxID=1917163 RepID=UPI0009704246|nr:hypothetical protein [Shewanella sp. UCD-KL12]